MTAARRTSILRGQLIREPFGFTVGSSRKNDIPRDLFVGKRQMKSNLIEALFSATFAHILRVRVFFSY